MGQRRLHCLRKSWSAMPTVQVITKQCTAVIPRKSSAIMQGQFQDTCSEKNPAFSPCAWVSRYFSLRCQSSTALGLLLPNVSEVAVVPRRSNDTTGSCWVGRVGWGSIPGGYIKICSRWVSDLRLEKREGVSCQDTLCVESRWSAELI